MFLRTMVAAAWIAASAQAVAGEWLYVATAPGSTAAAAPVGGRLYSVGLPGGKATAVGDINVAGKPIAVTGLAVQPIVGTLYGITPDASPHHPRALVTIDPKSASAIVVGNLGLAGSDIAFDKHGTLYIWLRETSQIGTVSLRTGEARPLGPTKAASEPGGISIDGGGRVWVVSSGATGSIDRIDSVSGRARSGPTLDGAPYPAGINAISIAADGRIFALNSSRGAPAKAALVAIDPATGKVAHVGPLPDDADAMVLVEAPWSLGEFVASPAGMGVIAGLVALVLIFTFMLRAAKRPRTAA